MQPHYKTLRIFHYICVCNNTRIKYNAAEKFPFAGYQPPSSTYRWRDLIVACSAWRKYLTQVVAYSYGMSIDSHFQFLSTWSLLPCPMRKWQRLLWIWLWGHIDQGLEELSHPNMQDLLSYAFRLRCWFQCCCRLPCVNVSYVCKWLLSFSFLFHLFLFFVKNDIYLFNWFVLSLI